MQLVSFDALRTMDIPGVVYIKPEAVDRHRDAIKAADCLLFPQYWQVNGFHYGMKKAIFPSISTYHIGHDKIEMTRLVQLLWPDAMPETYILPNSDRSRDWVLDQMSFPFVAKDVASSMGDGVWLIEDRDDWRTYWPPRTVLYVQEYLPIERDMRLVIIGRRVVAGYWRCKAQPLALHTNVAKGGQVLAEDIPPSAVALVEEMARMLDIDHAGFDIADVGGRYYFFEFNRLFGTAGLVRQGISTGGCILDYLRQRLL